MNAATQQDLGKFILRVILGALILLPALGHFLLKPKARA